jgi:phage repressor protein C with HTH and peptisase S24 domain
MVDKAGTTRFAERFELMLAACNLTRAEFAHHEGIGQQNVTNWIKRGRVGQHSAARVREITGVSIDWLNEGVGNPPNASQIREPAMPYTAREILPTSHQANFFRSETPPGYVRFEHMTSPQGDLMNNDFPKIVNMLEVRDAEAVAITGRQQTGAIRMSGIGSDSMAPTLNPKDIVFIDTDIHQFDSDGIYFFLYDNSLYCKRLQKVQRGTIAVISDNKNYAPWEITADDPTPWQVVARVLSVLPLAVQSFA